MGFINENVWQCCCSQRSPLLQLAIKGQIKGLKSMRTLSILYLANREPDLAYTKHWAMASSVMCLSLSISAQSVFISGSSAQLTSKYYSKQAEVSPALTLHFSLASWSGWELRRGCRAWLRVCNEAFLTLVSCLDSPPRSLAILIHWVASVSLVPTTSWYRDARVVGRSLFPCPLVWDLHVDGCRPPLAPRGPHSCRGCFAFLQGSLLKFTGYIAITNCFAKNS